MDTRLETMKRIARELLTKGLQGKAACSAQYKKDGGMGGPFQALGATSMGMIMMSRQLQRVISVWDTPPKNHTTLVKQAELALSQWLAEQQKNVDACSINLSDFPVVV